MKSVALHNLGCKVNAYELEVIGQKLQESGYTLVPFDSVADIYIVNTCTVTNIADRKSRQMLHRARRMNPDAVVVALGCYVQTEGEDADDCIDLAIGNNRKNKLLQILEAYMEERKTPLPCSDDDRKNDRVLDIIDIGHASEYEEMTLEGMENHTRAYIKIQDGCNQFCSYCIIPYARGRVRSRSEQDVLNEVHGLVAAGYREVVLTGIHLSSYGMDFVSGEQGRESVHDGLMEGTDYLESRDARQTAFDRAYLLKLIRAIAQIDGVDRIRLGSLEPRIITEDFVRELADIPQICPHFHLSLQSGCNETLKRMNRHYTAEEYSERVEILREMFDHPAVTTDVICGFPGETEEEFAKTTAFLKEISFFEMHIFKYSRRRGTAAAAMEGQLTEAVKGVRSCMLMELEKEQSRSFREAYIGKELCILTEENKIIDGRSYCIGYTDRYVKAAFPCDLEVHNRLVTGVAAGFLTEEILLLDQIKGAES